MSKKTLKTCCLLSRAIVIKLSASQSAVRVLNPERKPCCECVIILSFVNLFTTARLIIFEKAGKIEIGL